MPVYDVNLPLIILAEDHKRAKEVLTGIAHAIVLSNQDLGNLVIGIKTVGDDDYVERTLDYSSDGLLPEEDE